MAMKRSKIIITIIFSIMIISMSFAVVIAQASTQPPAFPSSFYGLINDESVTENSVVKVWINGQLITTSTVITYGADLVYSIRIPADDPSTPDVLEGGRDGDVVIFTIDELTARHNDNNIWQGGTNIQLDLSLNEPVFSEEIYLPLIIR
jgi:hypothetical protein